MMDSYEGPGREQGWVCHRCPMPRSLRRTGLLVLATAWLMACGAAAPPEKQAEQQVAAPAEEAPAAAPVADEARAARKTKAAANQAEKEAPLDGAAASPEPFDSLPVFDDRQAPRVFVDHWGINPTVATEASPEVSLLAVPDRASFVLSRFGLEQGEMPPRGLVRTESFLAAVWAGAAPAGVAPELEFELTEAPWRPGYDLLRIRARAPEPAPADDGPLVFAVAVSDRHGRVGVVEGRLDDAMANIRGGRNVGLVNGELQDKGVSLPTTNRSFLNKHIDRLQAGGPLIQVLEVAHRTAGKAGRVVLYTDGLSDGLVPETGPLLDAVADRAEAGHRLTVVGVGRTDYDDALLLSLSRAARGPYGHVDAQLAADDVAAERSVSPLRIRFDPAAVDRYRLLGYESRLVSSSSGAGGGQVRVPAGATMDLLIEIKRRPGAPLTGSVSVGAGGQGETDVPFPGDLERVAFDDARAELLLPIVAAATAEKLRKSYWVRELPWATIRGWMSRLDGETRKRSDVLDLMQVIVAASELDGGDAYADYGPLAETGFDSVPVFE